MTPSTAAAARRSPRARRRPLRSRLAGALCVPALACALLAAGADDEARGGAGRGAEGDATSLLLVTWDTTRADRIGAYGWPQARTPAFDALAARGVLWERAYAAAPVTLPSHTTILTGVYPCAHGVRDNAIFEVGSEARLLSEALREAGFATGAFVASFILDPKFGLAQGFDAYEAPPPAALGLGWNVIERSAAEVTEGALRFIDALEPGRRFFLWVHYYDPHAPHEVAAGERTGAQDDYDAEITRCDAQTARLLERLAARGLDHGLLTVVTSDHGESNGEHGEQTHGAFVYDATMRVPLVVAPPPPGTPPGTRVAAPVSTADVAATVLERLGVGRGALPDARTPPLVLGEPADDARAIWLEAYSPFYSHRWHPLRAVVWKGMKYIEAPRRELYALGSPETENLLDARPEIARALAARLDALAAEHAPLGWEALGTITSEDAGKLAALGYAGVAAAGDPTDPSLPDPKDRIGDLARLDRLEVLLFEAKRALKLDVALRTGRRVAPTADERRAGEETLAQARAELAELRAANPGDPLLDQIESSIEIDLGNYAAAVAPLERAVARTPRNMPLHYNLAVAYANTGEPDLAVREMEKAIFVEPRSLPAHRWLVQFCVARKDWPAAAWWLDELAKLPGQSAGDHDGIRRARERVAGELAAAGARPRPPRPVSDEELAPERVRREAGREGSSE